MKAAERVQKLLDLLVGPFGAYIENSLQQRFGDRWIAELERRSGRPPRRKREGAVHWDVQAAIRAMLDHWNDVFGSACPQVVRSYVSELRIIRNRFAHQEDISDADAARAADTALRLAEALELTAAVSELTALRDDAFASVIGVRTSVSPQLPDQRPKITNPSTGARHSTRIGLASIKKGWLLAVLGEGAESPRLDKISCLTDLPALANGAEVVCVDVPVGLLAEARPGGRTCERLARTTLPGKRASSVFSSPVRATLAANSYEEAVRLNRSSSSFGLGISKQSYAMMPKILEVDTFIGQHPEIRVCEVHPEVCLTILAGDDLDSRSSEAGLARRKELVALALNCSIDSLVEEGERLGARPLDALDALVAVLTASRIIAGSADSLPREVECDDMGRRMAMWF